MPTSDFVFLDENSPEDIIGSEDQYERGAWFLSKNMDMIPLSKLGELLGVAPVDELMEGFQPAIEPTEEGSYLFSIPTALSDKIKRLSNTEIINVAPRWAQTEELSGLVDGQELVEFLLKLKDFLNQKNLPVYLCLSL